MKTIDNKDDIKILVDNFYNKIKTDDLLSPIFVDLMKVNWEKHLPKMYDFWEMILLDGSSYIGTPMRPHLVVNNLTPLSSTHFERWLNLFFGTVDEHFTGEKADEIKKRAYNIANTWAYKMEYINKQKEENQSFDSNVI